MKINKLLLAAAYLTATSAVAQQQGGGLRLEVKAPIGGFSAGHDGGSRPPSIGFAVSCSGSFESGAGPSVRLRVRVQSSNAAAGRNFDLLTSSTPTVGCGARGSDANVSFNLFPNDVGPDVTGTIRIGSIGLVGSSAPHDGPVAQGELLPIEEVSVPFVIRTGGTPNLDVALSPSVASLSAGQQVQFRIGTANLSAVINSAVTRMNITIPDGLTLNNIPAPGCIRAGQNLDCPLGVLAHSSSAALPMSMTANGDVSGKLRDLLITMASGNGASTDTATASVNVINSAEPPPGPVTGESKLLNISTNGVVDGGGMQAGFIVVGEGEKQFAVLAEDFGLQDPTLDVVEFVNGQIGATMASNDDWRDHPSADELVEKLRAPNSERSAAFAVTLPPGTYLARVGGKGGATGRALVGVQELEDDGPKLLNISTNGIVDGNGMQAGFVVSGEGSKRFAVLAEDFGLEDPTLSVVEFIDGEIGDTLASNDDWQTHPSAGELVEKLRAPNSERSAAFAVTLPPGTYLAIVNGKNGATGRAVVGVQEIAD